MKYKAYFLIWIKQKAHLQTDYFWDIKHWLKVYIALYFYKPVDHQY